VKTGKNLLIIYAPPKRLWLKNKKKIFLSEREKVGGKKGVCGARGKRGGDFLFKPP
jgi:hypothetical protein